jgi:hypothetical protein
VTLAIDPSGPYLRPASTIQQYPKNIQEDCGWQCDHDEHVRPVFPVQVLRSPIVHISPCLYTLRGDSARKRISAYVPCFRDLRLRNRMRRLPPVSVGRRGRGDGGLVVYRGDYFGNVVCIDRFGGDTRGRWSRRRGWLERCGCLTARWPRGCRHHVGLSARGMDIWRI